MTDCNKELYSKWERGENYKGNWNPNLGIVIVRPLREQKTQLTAKPKLKRNQTNKAENNNEQIEISITN